MTAYSLHLHDGDGTPPLSNHVEASNDEQAKRLGLEWLNALPRYKHVTIVEDMRLVARLDRRVDTAPVD